MCFSSRFLYFLFEFLSQECTKVYLYDSLICAVRPSDEGPRGCYLFIAADEMQIRAVSIFKDQLLI